MNGPPSQSDQSQMLQDYLSKYSEPCPSCEYDLHGLKGKRCPECGQELLLRVGLATPNLGLFIVGLVGLASATGFSGSLLVFVAYVLLFSGIGGGPEIIDIAVLLVELFISIVLIIIWSRANRWYRRQSKSTRWALAIACWILPVLSLIVFAVIVD